MQSTARRQRGFTLLEILIVVLIIAILVGTAVIGLGRLGGAGEAEETARRLAALLRLASDEAVINARELGLFIDGREYRFLAYNGEIWLPLEGDRLLAPGALPPGVRIELIQDGRPLSLAPPPGATGTGEDAEQEDAEPGHPPPQILLLSSGELSPFELWVEAREGGARWRVSGSLTGEISVERRE